MEPASEEATPAPASAILPQPQLSSTQDDNAAKSDTEQNQTGLSNGNAGQPENDNTIPPVPDNGNPDEPTLPNLDSAASSSKSRPVSSVIPPFWQRHERSVSRASLSSLAQSRIIRLEDHTADPDSETSRGLWARSVAIDDHVVVQGKSGVGSYVVWNCTIQTLDVSLACLRGEIFGVGLGSDCVLGRSDCCSNEV